MGSKTSISWTNATWNAIRGCLRVSEGCKLCYAETVAARFSGEGQPYEGLAKWVQRGGHREARWTGEVMLVEERLRDPLKWGRPRMIFVNSTSDFFFEPIPTDYLDRMMAVMGLANHHTFQVLTKRPQRMHDYLSDPLMPARVFEQAKALLPNARWNGSLGELELRLANLDALPNVWWGVSVENQDTANARLPLLIDTPAAVRFASYEPAIGPIDFGRIVERDSDGTSHWYLDTLRGHVWDDENGLVDETPPALDWIIVGGESSQLSRPARPFEINWAADLIKDALSGSSTAIFVKQLGSDPVTSLAHAYQMAPPLMPEGAAFEDRDGWRHWKINGKADDPSAFPPALRMQEYPGGTVRL